MLNYKLKTSLIFLFIVFHFSASYAQLITLPNYWLIKTGDNHSYSSLSFDDRRWDSIRVPSFWENEGYNGYDGFAWYRVHFKVDKKHLNKELYLLPGRIDDVDETYLNGKLIGSMGKMPPETFSEWNAQRAYRIPKGLLKETNVLAIRVYDWKINGGIHSGVIGVLGKKEYIAELNLGPPPKKSFYQLVTSNGLIAAIYNEKTNIIEAAYPHIFQSYDENKRVQPFIRNIKINNDEKPVSISYLENTHVIDLSYKKYSISYFAPITTKEKILYILAEGNEKEIDKLDFTFEEDKAEVLKEKILISKNPAKAKLYFLFSFNDSLHNNSRNINKAVERLKSSDLLSDELAFMKSIHSKAFIPAGMSKSERNLYEQSISVLKMAQVPEQEIFPKAKGQILASLPPGNWNITWLRDGTYAIMGLNRLGLFNEAKNALDFYLNADAGFYKKYIHSDGKDYGTGVDYKVSVTRYFGIGKEESDFNENGPNIELDGFGLFLLAYTDYVNRSNDSIYFKNNFDVVSKLIADPIIAFIDTNNIVRIDSGPWEEHLPGRQFAFTSITASAGLERFAELSRKYRYDSSEKYSSTAKKISRGIKENFIYQNKSVKGFTTAENPKTMNFYDGGTIELFNYDQMNDNKFFKSYYKDYEDGLRINKDRGFSRLNNPDWYTIGEWPFINLRIASSLIKFHRKVEAKKLIDWTTAQTKLNFNLIAELYDYKKSTYDGATPMVGYGAATYIITLCDYYNSGKENRVDNIKTN